LVQSPLKKHLQFL